MTTLPRQFGRDLLPVLGCALALVAPMLAGCSATSKDKKPADPILGELHPQGTPAFGPSPPPDKTKQSSSTGVPASFPKMGDQDPLLASASPSPLSNAYLASRTKPLPGTQLLAISEPGKLHLAGAIAELGDVRPIPPDPAFVKNSWSTPPPSAGNFGTGNFAAATPNFVDPTTARLQSRGIAHHRIDPLPDGTVRLTAVMPQAADPASQRLYEVTARDFQSAVDRLIAQIDAGK